MLQLIEAPSAKKKAQRALERSLKAALSSQGTHNIGYPGGNSDHTVYSEGEGSLYCAFSPPREESPVPRYWNSFGVFRPGHTQQIIVEINVPSEKNDARVAGFFATDGSTGETFLMHDGGLGGGRPGIGKQAFLDFLTDELVPVRNDRNIRYGLPIASLADPNLASLIWRFVKKVEAFKEAATTGQIALTEASDGDDEGSEYFPEFWGHKRGRHSGTFEYMSYHGMIIDQLKIDRETFLQPNEKLRKSRLVDLFVIRDGKRSEVYEVKTSCGRQSLYTAIGQLMIHGRNGAERILVLPIGDQLPSDCSEALESLGIGLRRYRIIGSGVRASIEFVPLS